MLGVAILEAGDHARKGADFRLLLDDDGLVSFAPNKRVEVVAQGCEFSFECVYLFIHVCWGSLVFHQIQQRIKPKLINAWRGIAGMLIVKIAAHDFARLKRATRIKIV